MKKKETAMLPLCLLFLVMMSCDPNTVTDVEGNVYKTVTIGSQVWMAENLKTTSYRDGSPIQYPGADTTKWVTDTDGSYAWYDDDKAKYRDTYGALYNWYAVVNPAGVCPSGWRVPDDDDWETLFDFLGGTAVAGGKMKTTGTLEDGTGLWRSPNTAATNESGFSGLPAGYRGGGGWYDYMGGSAGWWSRSDFQELGARSPTIDYGDARVFTGVSGYHIGFSVRCLKD